MKRELRETEVYIQGNSAKHQIRKKSESFNAQASAFTVLPQLIRSTAIDSFCINELRRAESTAEECQHVSQQRCKTGCDQRKDLPLAVGAQSMS